MESELVAVYSGRNDSASMPVALLILFHLLCQHREFTLRPTRIETLVSVCGEHLLQNLPQLCEKCGIDKTLLL